MLRTLDVEAFDEQGRPRDHACRFPDHGDHRARLRFDTVWLYECEQDASFCDEHPAWHLGDFRRSIALGRPEALPAGLERDVWLARFAADAGALSLEPVAVPRLPAAAHAKAAFVLPYLVELVQLRLAILPPELKQIGQRDLRFAWARRFAVAWVPGLTDHYYKRSLPLLVEHGVLERTDKSTDGRRPSPLYTLGPGSAGGRHDG